MQQLRLILVLLVSAALIFTNLFDTTEDQVSVYGAAAIQPLGTGSESDPYRVESVAHLLWLKAELAKVSNTNFKGVYFRQTASIDLAGIAGWTPLGSGSVGFAGIYDGQGYTIDNLALVPDGQNGTGLFSVNFGTIRNLGLTGISITGGDAFDLNVGALTGINRGTIERCYSTGTIASGARTRSVASSVTRPMIRAVSIPIALLSATATAV